MFPPHSINNPAASRKTNSPDFHKSSHHTRLLGNVEEAQELIGEAIELGGDAMRLRALDDEHLIRVWAGP